MYDETTNEWQFIASFKKPGPFETLLGAEGRMYAVSCDIQDGCDLQQITVECYNPETNEWEIKTETAVPVNNFCLIAANACTVRLFKGLPNIRPLDTITPNNPAAATST